MVLSTRAFPIVILAIPLAVTTSSGALRHGLGVALMHTALALPFTVLITSASSSSVPRELEEAAQTLGCSPLQAFLRVVAAARPAGPRGRRDLHLRPQLERGLRGDDPDAPEPDAAGARSSTALDESPIHFQFAAGFVMLVPSLIFIFFIRRYLLGLWGRVVK